MAHAYTPGLRVAAWTTLRRERRLPIAGDVLVTKGERVSAEQVVARTELPGHVQMIKVAAILGQQPADLPHHMRRKEGERVAKDETIAFASGLFGLSKTTCPSPVDGVIESVSTITGQVAIREAPIPLEIDAYITGEVVEVIPREGVCVEAQGAFLQGIFGVGGEAHGTLRLAVSSPEAALVKENLPDEAAGAVLIGGAFVDEPTLREAAARGARAIIVGGLDAADLQRFLGYDLGVAITGSERLGLTLIMTEGFGRMAMAARTFELLARHQGKPCAVNGATQIRAGVVRPEIIIPLAREDGESAQAARDDGDAGLRRGSLVRVIRAPHFGRWGKIVELPAELAMVDSEARVRVVRVRFAESAEEALVPRANVEMMEP